MLGCFDLCLDFVKFYHQINILKSILYRNSYPCDFVEKYRKEFLDRVLTRKVVVSTMPKKDLIIVLPYLGKLLLQIRARVNRVMKNKLHHFNFRIAFQTKCKLVNSFTFKDKIPVFLCFGIVYKFKCWLAAILRIMTKLSAILKSECVSILMESISTKRDNLSWNENRHFLPLELFDDIKTYFYHMITVH